ncbi:unnamed protein product [Trifolium pratense]|uniref:Uncharacterized protein n=1 Tax=Trifolium pratense TaxID=57577 RepID=A0ACB0L8S9_TRIPR|nr:unnamed protein product [Trifolium pratense]
MIAKSKPPQNLSILLTSEWNIFVTVESSKAITHCCGHCNGFSLRFPFCLSGRQAFARLLFTFWSGRLFRLPFPFPLSSFVLVLAIYVL